MDLQKLSNETQAVVLFNPDIYFQTGNGRLDGWVRFQATPFTWLDFDLEVGLRFNVFEGGDGLWT